MLIWRHAPPSTNPHQERVQSRRVINGAGVIPHRFSEVGDEQQPTVLLNIQVGGLLGDEILQRLSAASVRLNKSAQTLMNDLLFDAAHPEAVDVVTCRVGDLGLTLGARLPAIFEAARAQGLQLCPPTTGPYLRLAMRNQSSAPDSILSNGRVPTGSITVASPRLQADDDYPRGFYLRVLDGHMWLRGYRCSDQYIWDPQDVFAFRVVTTDQAELAHRTSGGSGPA